MYSIIMNDGFNVIKTAFDKILLILIGWFLSVVFFAWFLANIVRSNNYYFWILTIPLGLILSFFLVNQYKFNLQLSIKNNIFSRIIFIFLLVFVIGYYLEPIVRYPMSTIGIPNKDLHDGISVFIADRGYPPPINNEIDTAYIIDTRSAHGQEMLGYPNVLHSFSALLIKIGVFSFHATWISSIIGIIINSLTIYLFLKVIYQDDTFSSIIAGLFGISTIRLALAIVASVPMFFGYSLLLPSFLILITSIYHYQGIKTAILPIISFILIAACYPGIIIFYVGLIFLLAVVLLLSNNYEKVKNLIGIVVLSLPFIIFSLFKQNNIYWANTFATPAKDFDPNELGPRILPLERPIFVFTYLFSIITSIFLLIKSGWIKAQKNWLRILFIIINIGLGSVIFYNLTFNKINNITSHQSLNYINTSGFFGGLFHQQLSRLALLQPFFFLLIVGDSLYFLLKYKNLKYLLIIILFLLNFIIRWEQPPYQLIENEVRPSFYNQDDNNKKYTLISHLRLVINYKIWSQDIFGALDWLKDHKNNNKILVWDERMWTEETIAGWGSLYIHKKIYQPSEFGIKDLILNYSNISLINNKKLLLLVIEPTYDNLLKIKTIPGSTNLYSNGMTHIYQLQ